MRPALLLCTLLCAALALAAPVDRASGAAMPVGGAGDAAVSAMDTTIRWTATTPGPALHGEAVAFAPSACSLVAFGGGIAPDGWNRGTWLFEPAKGTWTSVALSRKASPAWRDHARMAWDPVRGRLVMFGGRAFDTDLRDTWAFDAVKRAWSPLVTSCRRGTACPPARDSHGMVWSSVLGQVVVFGGASGEVDLTDTWAFDGTAWKQLATVNAPPARHYFGMAEDPATGRIVVHGGLSSDLTTFTDTWILDPRTLTWSKAKGAVVPEPTTGVGMSYIESVGAIVLAGGAIATSCSTGASTSWAFDMSRETWVQLQADGVTPTPRVGAFLVADTCAGNGVLIGLPRNMIDPLPPETDYAWILE